MHKFRKLKFAAILVMIFAIFASLLPTPVMADEDDDNGTTFAEKILLNTFRLCYSDSVMPNGVADGGTDQYSYINIRTLYPQSDDTQLLFDGQPVLNVTELPNGKDIDDIIDDFKMNKFESDDALSQCETLFKLLHPKRTPVVDVTTETLVDPVTGEYHISKRSGASTEEIDSFLQQMGYVENPDKDTRRPVCAEINYKPGSDDSFYTYKTLGYVCWDDASIFDASNLDARPFTPGNYLIINKSPDIGTIRIDNNTGRVDIEGLGVYDDTNNPINLGLITYDASDTQNPAKYGSCQNPKPPYDQGANVPSPETTCFDGTYVSTGDDEQEKFKYYIMTRIINDKTTARELYDSSKFFAIDNWGDAFLTARGNLNKKYASVSTIYLPFTWQEIFNLYAHYLTNTYGVVVDASDCITQADPSRVYTSAGWCRYLTSQRDTEWKVAVFPNDAGSLGSNVVLNAQTNLSGLLEKMYIIASRETINGVTLNDKGSLVDPMPLLSTRRVSVLEDRCYINGESLGWVLCPIIEFAHDAMESMYRDIVQGYLTIDTVLLTTTNPEGVNQSGTYQAWSIFVGFANVLMIIFLLVIIFSQVTGVGIDNYGIKKALPKIIIAAVLINLSFIICQLLADLSNILGNSLENLLTNIGDNLTRQTSLQGSYASGEAFRGILDLLLVAGGVTAAVTTVSTALTSGPLGLLIPLLVGLLVALAAILFFFVLLGIRKAAIVMLVAVSPIAFACYMLPNLKQQVFDRWFGLLKAMLLAYPLCGLVMGGSNLASAILMSTGMEENFIFYFINMLLMVVPFFFMPSLIKKSMGALGNITAIASRAVRGRINRGGMQARKWNESRPINQQRRAIRDDNRKRRWENGINRRYQNGTDSFATRIPGIGGAIKRRRDNMYGAAIQSAQERQSKEAMRQALINSGGSILEASGTKSRLDAQRSAGEVGNYANEGFATGTGFLNQQIVEDKRERATRYAGKQAQEAYKNRMESMRDKEAKDDAILSKPLALSSAMQGNLAKAAAQREENMAALLAAGKLSVTGMIVDPSSATSMGKAYSRVLSNLAKAEAGSEEYHTAMAQAGAIQRAMMANGGGRNGLRQIYQGLARESSIHDNVRMAAQNFATAQSDALESNGMFDIADIANDIASGKMTIAKEADGQYLADNIGKLSPANLKNFDPETVSAYVDYINNLYAHSWNAAHAAEYSERVADADRFLSDVVSGYLSPQNIRNQKQEITRVLQNLNPSKTE